MLINQLVRKEMREQIEKEDKIYKRLILKTAHIRETYVKRQAGKAVFEATTYAEG